MHVPLVEQELFTVPEHLGSPLVISGVRVTRSLVSCVYFVDRCLSFCTFSFGQCIVCSSSKYDYDYPFGISKLFVQMYNYISLIPVIINSLNCSDIVVNIDTSTNGLFTNICQRQIIKQLFLDVLHFVFHIELLWVSNSYPWYNSMYLLINMRKIIFQRITCR